MRVADYVVSRINEQCAKHIFTITGRGILYLTDALAKHDELKGIFLHHEQAASYAAYAYGSYTQRPGICLVSTGCAATNTITGVLNAWQDEVSCLFISGQNMLNETVNYRAIPIRTFGSQETDIISIVNNITKYSVMVTDSKKIAYEMDKALYMAQNGIKGPVWVDVPLDIQNMRIEPSELERFSPEDDMAFEPSQDDIDYVLSCLEKSRRPVVLIGSGIRQSDAISSLKNFIEKNNIPLTYAHSATDVYSFSNELSIGSVGSLYGTRAGNFAVQNSDLLIVIGCRMTTMTTGSQKDKFARTAKIIVIDINKDEFLKNTVNIDRLIVSNAKTFLDALVQHNVKKPDNNWANKCIHWKNIFPKCEEIYKQSERIDLYYLSDVLSRTLPENSVFLTDAGLEELILPANICFKENMRCIHPTMQGSMGFALPGAIGAYYASGSPVCAVIGDGSVMMNLQEFDTVRYNNIPIKVIIINNNMYSIIRKRQVDMFRTRTIGTDPENGVSAPNFKKIADAFSIPYMKIETSSSLELGLREFFQIQGPVICEIMALIDQEYLCDAYAKNSEKKIVHRPIEDLFPFIDRELFLSEMVIEPIDQ
jgi:acetolactate synthase-1/2/3 large subunit